MSATIKDIAKETGLGLATISSYLNGGSVREKNRIKIEEAIKRLNFEVNEMARSLKTNKTKTIGIVIPELNNIFCAEIITEIEDILRNHGYATMICDCRTDITREVEAVEFLYKKRVDGLIHIPVSSDGTHLDSFKNAGKPIVIVDRKIEEDSCDFVLVDNEVAVYDAVSLLIEYGHKKIGIISGPKEIYTARKRLNGYIQALTQAEIKVEESLIIYGDNTIASGVKCLEELVKERKDMSALLITNYEMTVGGMIGIHEMGISIPKDLSVIGYDNYEFASSSNPKLVIVTQPTKEIGRNVANLMIERLEDNRKESKSIILESTITKGGSIANL